MTNVQKNRLQVLVNNLNKFKESAEHKDILRNGDAYSFNGVGNETYMQLTGKGEWRNGNFFTEESGFWCNFLCPEAATFFGYSGDTTITIDNKNLQRKFELGSTFRTLAIIIEDAINV